MKSSTAAAALYPDAGNDADEVHTWRVSQLIRIGLASPVAEVVADRVDWHDVANLVRRGCPASLAVTIID